MPDVVRTACRKRLGLYRNGCVKLLIWLSWLLFPLASDAAPKPNDVCDLAAQRASQVSGVPSDVLKAITRTETGRKYEGQFGPWPWTVNMEGKGVWFETDDAARAFVYKHFKRGARSFDVGCFQINYRWHHKEFSSLEEMFDPTLGANYAAKFLKKLHRELGTWEAAVGAYHSRTPRHAKRYTALYKQHLAQVRSAPVTKTPRSQTKPATRTRRNHFPLLTPKGEAVSAGSLVLLSENSGQRGALITRAARGVFP